MIEIEVNLPPKAKPEVLPKPTYWPFLSAVSLVLVAWGAISIWVISAVGLAGFAICIGGWINELINENNNHGK